MITTVGAVLLVGALAGPAAAQTYELPETDPCRHMTPRAVSASKSTTPITLRVAVVLHGVEIEEARPIVARAQQAYTPLGITLEPTFLFADVSDRDTMTLLNKVRKLLGGARPDWAHAVVVVSSQDLASGGPTSGDGTAGQVECVGGIDDPVTAFAVAESGSSTKDGAEIFGHELGHLLGAHHHLANCAEGTREGPDVSDACSIMFNNTLSTSLVFDTANAAVVRGYAETYVKPLAARPPRDGLALTTLPRRLDPCDTALFDDPAGDDSGMPTLRAGEGDLRDGRFFLRDGKPWFRVTVAEIDGDLESGSKVSWRLAFSTVERSYALETRWDGKGAPATTFTENGGGPVTQLPGAVVIAGTPGRVEIPWPLGARTLVRFGQLSASVGPLVKENGGMGYNGDTATSAVYSARPSDCAGAADASRPAAGGVGAGPGGAGAGGPGGAAGPLLRVVGESARAGAPASPGRSAATGSLRLKLLTTSARRASGGKRVGVRITGTASRLVLRLLDRRGREVGRGTVARVAGTATVAVRLRRAVRAGRYTLVVSGAGAKATRTAVTLR